MGSDPAPLRVVFAPDSFKGTFSSADATAIMAEELLRVDPAATYASVIAADGGEGTCEAVASCRGGRLVSARVPGPLGAPVDARYAILPDGSAVLEMAAASGITLVDPADLDPLRASTAGTGALIADALARGCDRLAVGIGGSATNDAGTGAMAALGVRFLDEKNRELAGCGRDLAFVRAIDDSGLDAHLRAADVRVMCDVDSPLTGPGGATRVFGPQKGADPATVELLERGMVSYARVLDAHVGAPVSTRAGAGAAGGLGSALLAFAGAGLASGIECVLDLVGFDALLAGADACVTGEGHLDAQTEGGKVVAGVARRCHAAGVPCAAVVGASDVGAAGAARMGLSCVAPCVGPDADRARALAEAEPNLRRAARGLFLSMARRRAEGLPALG